MPAQLIVLDLDLTLWDCGRALWCDGTVPPYELIDRDIAVDRVGNRISLYPEVRTLLEEWQHEGIPLAIASRTSSPRNARQLLELFEIRDFFCNEQIYPSDKQAHLAEIQRATGISYSEMIFYDDEPRNIESVGELGVQVKLVRHGLRREDIE